MRANKKTSLMKALKQNEDFIILREDEVLPPSTMDDVRGGLAMMDSPIGYSNECNDFKCGCYLGYQPTCPTKCQGVYNAPVCGNKVVW